MKTTDYIGLWHHFGESRVNVIEAWVRNLVFLGRLDNNSPLRPLLQMLLWRQVLNQQGIPSFWFVQKDLDSSVKDLKIGLHSRYDREKPFWKEFRYKELNSSCPSMEMPHDLNVQDQNVSWKGEDTCQPIWEWCLATG